MSIELFQCPSCRKRRAMIAGELELTCRYCGFVEEVMTNDR